MPTHYEILGVSSDAGEGEIKKAYRQLSLQYHPDRNPDPSVQEKYKLINDAYDVLSDPQQKEKYDHEQKYGEGFHHVDLNGGVHDIFNMMFGMGFPGGVEHGFAGGPGIRIFHNGMQMNGGGGFHEHIFKQLHKPQPIIKHVEITLEQCYHGATIQVSIDRQVSVNMINYIETELMDITIPRGTDETDVMLIRNKGHSISDDIRGDLKITFSVINNTIFRRSGMDLVFTKHITLKESLCGFSFEINHLNGKTLNMNNLTNSAVIKPNYKKVVPGLGFIQGDQTGSLMVELVVDFPDTLTSMQIEALRSIL
jgi:DnaJ-class molecular chaperone|uniref:J domain-containing protein n=1 Tax=viral metagenome TaxID=1070528 RepID=A0A6C0DXG5_9ZZZZ